MLAPLLYNLLLLAASPLLLLYLGYRLGVQGKSRQGLGERWGGVPRLGPPPAAGRIWVHAVSAGEMVAAAAVVRRLHELDPKIEVAVSTTTPAGRQQAERLLPAAVARFYFPFDFLPCTLAALLRIRPTVVCPIETEIWPNWLWLARVLGCRAALVNGQFADKGFRRARHARPLYRWALHRLNALHVQTARAAERALFLGAPPERLRVAGNVKFEQTISALPAETEALLRRRLELDSGRPVWVAGSTHPGEEDQVLDAFQQAHTCAPELVLLLAPRHIERAPDVLAAVRARGWSADRRSSTETGPVEVLVLDTMGELAAVYALASVVFVGGSLAPIGGHDILQPLFHGRPVLFGPHMHNQHDLARLALDSGAALQVTDARELAAAVGRVCTDVCFCDDLAAAGRLLLADNAGAARAAAELLRSLARPGMSGGREPALGAR